MSFLKRLFTWWDGQTLGTQLYTARKGVLVGQDDLGNRYFQTRDGARRWVIYPREVEASTVPPEWHGWLHHIWEAPPSEVPLPKKPWEKPHRENLTGTPAAYAPPGSLRHAGGGLAPARRDYDAWQPE